LWDQGGKTALGDFGETVGKLENTPFRSRELA